jgi:hypothetical protein
MTLQLNTQEFDSKMKELLRDMPKIEDEVLEKLGWQIINDANTIEPKTPLLDGFLRDKVKVLKEEQGVAKIWFTMPYAAKWHEATDPEPNWSEKESGVGPKYLESKLLRFKSDYGEFLATLIKSEFKKL